MTATIHERERELDFRFSAGIEVRLLWNQLSQKLRVTAFDTTTGEELEIPAPPERALDVFHHPFAYASRTEAALAV